MIWTDGAVTAAAVEMIAAVKYGGPEVTTDSILSLWDELETDENRLRLHLALAMVAARFVSEDDLASLAAYVALNPGDAR